MVFLCGFPVALSHCSKGADDLLQMFGFNRLGSLPTITERATSSMETWVLVIICPDFPQVGQQGALMHSFSLLSLPAVAEEVSAGE